MGELEVNSATEVANNANAAVKRGSASAEATGNETLKEFLNLADPKVQGMLLVGLLAVLTLALLYEFTYGCLCRRRSRRRQRSCCS